MSEPLAGTFSAEHSALDPAAFKQRVRDWALLVWTPLDDEDNTANFATIVNPMSQLVASGKNPFAVATLTKRPGANPFALMITLGRAQNNDVVLNHGAVSKFHAYLRRLGESWMLSDAGSTNGSTLDGAKLEKHRAQPLGPRARIELGKDLKMIFFLPADLFEELGRF